MTKVIFAVLDGLGDRPVAEFGGKTPLEAAATPALDSLASRGSSGMLEVISGIAPESDAAVLALLGYDPHHYYTGRGPLEAVGINAVFRDGMLALRCNFATTSDGMHLLDRRAGRTLTSEEAALLADAINEKVRLTHAEFRFYASVAHRGALIIDDESGKLSAAITNTDPAYEIRNGIPHAMKTFEKTVKQAIPLNNSTEAKRAAELVNEFTEQAFAVLNAHPANSKRKENGQLPANTIICRDAGDRLPPLYNISETQKRKWAILANMPLEIGIGKLSGMRIVDLPLPTFTAADYSVMLEKIILALNEYDSVYVHIKSPDLFGHDGDHNGKKKCIEEIDRYFFSPLLEKINLSDTVIVVTADHATPCELKGHSDDAVPFIISGGSTSADAVKCFSERDCAAGNFGTIKGNALMDEILSML